MTAVAVKNVRSRKEWAEIINADWRKSIEGIIQTGRDLEAAFDELPRGEYAAMVERDLPFSVSTADKLRRIAKHPAISNSSMSMKLPPSWTVLSALSSLSAKDFRDARRQGLISPETTNTKAAGIVSAYKVPKGEETNPVGVLPTPKEATDIAAKTGRFVAANDGRIYTGATEEEGADFVRRRQQTYGIVDAVNALADCPVSPSKWTAEAEPYMLHKFRLGSVDAAIKWLTDLRPVLAKKTGIHDAK